MRRATFRKHVECWWRRVVRLFRTEILDLRCISIIADKALTLPGLILHAADEAQISFTIQSSVTSYRADRQLSIRLESARPDTGPGSAGIPAGVVRSPCHTISSLRLHHSRRSFLPLPCRGRGLGRGVPFPNSAASNSTWYHLLKSSKTPALPVVGAAGWQVEQSRSWRRSRVLIRVSRHVLARQQCLALTISERGKLVSTLRFRLINESEAQRLRLEELKVQEQRLWVHSAGQSYLCDAVAETSAALAPDFTLTGSELHAALPPCATRLSLSVIANNSSDAAPTGSAGGRGRPVPALCCPADSGGDGTSPPLSQSSVVRSSRKTTVNGNTPALPVPARSEPALFLGDTPILLGNGPVRVKPNPVALENCPALRQPGSYRLVAAVGGKEMAVFPFRIVSRKEWQDQVQVTALVEAETAGGEIRRQPGALRWDRHVAFYPSLSIQTAIPAPNTPVKCQACIHLGQSVLRGDEFILRLTGNSALVRLPKFELLGLDPEPRAQRLCLLLTIYLDGNQKTARPVLILPAVAMTNFEGQLRQDANTLDLDEAAYNSILKSLAPKPAPG